jgi:hypothetical protein
LACVKAVRANDVEVAFDGRAPSYNETIPSFAISERLRPALTASAGDWRARRLALWRSTGCLAPDSPESQKALLNEHAAHFVPLTAPPARNPYPKAVVALDVDGIPPSSKGVATPPNGLPKWAVSDWFDVANLHLGDLVDLKWIEEGTPDT